MPSASTVMDTGGAVKVAIKPWASVVESPSPLAVSWPERPPVTTFEPPPPSWSPHCHPLVQQVSDEVEQYFFDHWTFSDARSEEKFVKAGFSRATCLYFPLAKDDRIVLACQLLTVLFLIDDVLEDRSLEEGQRYNEELLPFCRGTRRPDKGNEAQFILFDLWQKMRDCDVELANAVLEPTFTFMRAQTDRSRLSIESLGRYLSYRERDVGKALLSSLMCFTMDLRMTDTELARLTELEQNSSYQISVVNDIHSWEKELKASFERHEEGASLCSAVKILMDETKLSASAVKSILWQMVREWERVHDRLKERMLMEEHIRPEMQLYVQGLQYQISGNELWSMTTDRYAS